jgi:two-component system, OmpR family, alkaline phosphatase synthesis response regulator PhoP
LSSTLSALVALPPMQTLTRVLVISDDRFTQKALQRLLESDGYVVAVAVSTAGPEVLHTAPLTALVLDLPRKPMAVGRQMFEKIRQYDHRIPVVVLGAFSEADTVRLLELGVSDYVPRPFHGRELLARIRAAIRRNLYPDEMDIFTFDGITVDFRTMEVRREGRFVPFTPQEFKLLKFMTQNPERVLSRHELLREIAVRRKSETSRIVDNLIQRLRRKLEKSSSRPLYFRTVQRCGYKFVP